MPDLKPGTALIVGASRGLGLGLAEALKDRGWDVTATVRKPSGAGNGKIETLDINDAGAVEAFAAKMTDHMFDVVFINAGVGGPSGKTAATVTDDEAMHVFLTNAVAPVRLAMKLADTVRPGTGIIAFMSSLLGSIERNSNGASPIYSASKAALNQLTKGFAANLPKDRHLTVLTFHPGWVRTDMGGPNADIDIATSVKGMIDVLAAKVGAGDHEFLDYRGRKLPW